MKTEHQSITRKMDQVTAWSVYLERFSQELQGETRHLFSMQTQVETNVEGLTKLLMLNDQQQNVITCQQQLAVQELQRLEGTKQQLQLDKVNESCLKANLQQEVKRLVKRMKELERLVQGKDAELSRYEKALDFKNRLQEKFLGKTSRLGKELCVAKKEKEHLQKALARVVDKSGVLSAQHEEQLVALDTLIASLQSQVSSLSSGTGHLEKRNVALSKEIAGFHVRVEDLEAERTLLLSELNLINSTLMLQRQENAELSRELGHVRHENQALSKEYSIAARDLRRVKEEQLDARRQRSHLLEVVSSGRSFVADVFRTLEQVSVEVDNTVDCTAELEQRVTSLVIEPNGVDYEPFKGNCSCNFGGKETTKSPKTEQQAKGSQFCTVETEDGQQKDVCHTVRNKKLRAIEDDRETHHQGLEGKHGNENLGSFSDNKALIISRDLEQTTALVGKMTICSDHLLASLQPVLAENEALRHEHTMLREEITRLKIKEQVSKDMLSDATPFCSTDSETFSEYLEESILDLSGTFTGQDWNPESPEADDCEERRLVSMERLSSLKVEQSAGHRNLDQQELLSRKQKGLERLVSQYERDIEMLTRQYRLLCYQKKATRLFFAKHLVGNLLSFLLLPILACLLYLWFASAQAEQTIC